MISRQCRNNRDACAHEHLLFRVPTQRQSIGGQNITPPQRARSSRARTDTQMDRTVPRYTHTDTHAHACTRLFGEARQRARGDARTRKEGRRCRTWLFSFEGLFPLSLPRTPIYIIHEWRKIGPMPRCSCSFFLRIGTSGLPTEDARIRAKTFPVPYFFPPRCRDISALTPYVHVQRGWVQRAG